MEKKIIISDFDGTFYRTKEELIKNIKIINKFRTDKNVFMIATGRSYVGFLEQIKDYPVFYDYIILCNGALILNNKNEYIKHYSIERDLINQINTFLIQFSSFIKKFTYVSKYKNFDNDQLDIEMLKIKLHLDDDQIAPKICAALLSKFKNINAYIIPLNKGCLIEIISNETSKSKAIKYLSGKLEYSQKEIITIGDSDNDLEMILDFNGYAINSATNEFISKAGRTIEDISTLIEKHAKIL
ncbi:HAD superfamily hydrolase [Alteracholeplasma palmae J233]|uniref:HAD superfamily hydrolase n=1 Tax=Alteracholeplasma palmae (strain ATCC 49389 / J233) TaxID=1318466 RepID=U4KKV9_ALTPJ|nr:HAD-IIB family hydrolase [Alteracholeplasma palmae]CCV64434.1 HAD superfamily hydrolase [Alteracholeplasma palmae J233]